MQKRSFLSVLGIVFLGLALSVSSCKKSSGSGEYGNSVNSISDLLNLPIYDLPQFAGFQSFTMGLLFKPTKDGRITHLGAKLSSGTYTVALWDSSAQSIIKSANVMVTDSSQFTFVDIEDVAVSANKTYAISINNTPLSMSFKKYWIYGITDPSNNFPHSVGDITFISEIEKQTSNALSLFPGNTSSNYVIGFPAFRFEPRL